MTPPTDDQTAPYARVFSIWMYFGEHNFTCGSVNPFMPSGLIYSYNMDEPLSF